MKSKVAVIRCPEYDAGKILNAISEGFSRLGGAEQYFKKEEKFLLKPNLLAAKKPEIGVTTHPEFLRACIRYFKKINENLAVGDSPGGAVAGVERVWNETGISAVVEEEKAEKKVFEKYGASFLASRNPRNKRVRTIEISSVVLDGYSIISLPKMKTHTLMLFTGALKNLYGCVPGLRKAHYHFCAVHPDDFGELLADIVLQIKPKFAIVDAITSMEGDGPSAGKLRNTGLIIMGQDLVAVDAVMAYIMGYAPLKDPTLSAAQRLNLGCADLKDIDVFCDGKLDDYIIRNFKKPSNWKIKMMPRFLGTLAKKIFWAKPKIIQTVCTRCQLCLNSCPAEAIFKSDDGAVIVNKKLCIECMCCHELCPEKAIEIEYSWLADILTKNSSSRKAKNKKTC